MRDPKILLLDEATSALDTENERVLKASISPITLILFVLLVGRRSIGGGTEGSYLYKDSTSNVNNL